MADLRRDRGARRLNPSRVASPFVLLLVWAVLRGRGAFVLGGVAAVLPALALSVALYGWDNHLDYLRVLAFIGERGESYFANNSVVGLLHRFLQTGPNLTWDPHAFPPPVPLVTTIGTIVGAALLGAALWPAGARDEPLDFGAVALAATIASPVVWEHHYGILPPLLLLAAARLAAAGPAAPRGGWLLLVAAYLLSANFLAPLHRLADTALNPLQSHLLFGGLLCFGLLLPLRYAPAERW